jgi:hypothetical protein
VRYPVAHEKKFQLSKRIPAPFIRRLLAEFRRGQILAATAIHELQISRIALRAIGSAAITNAPP